MAQGATARRTVLLRQGGAGRGAAKRYGHRRQKERKALTKSFEARRKELEASAHAIGAAELPGLAERLRALHTELQPALRAAEAQCLRRRSALAAMPEEATRAEACRVFYDD